MIQTEQKLTDKEAMDIIKGRYDELTEYVLRIVLVNEDKFRRM